MIHRKGQNHLKICCNLGNWIQDSLKSLIFTKYSSSMHWNSVCWKNSKGFAENQEHPNYMTFENLQNIKIPHGSCYFLLLFCNYQNLKEHEVHSATKEMKNQNSLWNKEWANNLFSKFCPFPSN